MSEKFFPFLWYNNKYISSTKNLFSAFSRNVNYGDGIFETLRVKQDKIYFWDFHYERLQKGIQTLGLIPNALLQNKVDLSQVILELLQKNKVKNTVKVKILVFRDNEENHTVNHANTLIYCVETLPDSYLLLNKKAILYTDVLLNYSVLSSIKTLNRLPYVLASIHAQKHHVEDAILLNVQQELTESTHSNLFYIIDNKICTPPLSSGCLDGIMRKVIMQHFRVAEKPLLLKVLPKVQTLFTTNVIRGINVVSSLKGLNKEFDTQNTFIEDIFCFLNKF